MLLDDPSLERVRRRLASAGCVAADEEADELVAAAPEAGVLEEWIARREVGEPLAWVTGRVDFCGRTLGILPGVYVPRPQSEGLAVRAAAALDRSVQRRAADLCTGCGAVASHLASSVADAAVVGVDLDPLAAATARRNGVAAVRGDLGDPLASGAFDVVTAVAPYVPSAARRFLPADVQRYEPALSLDGGPDGLAVLRGVVSSAARLLGPGGRLFVELGGDQDRGLARHLAAGGFDRIAVWHDEEGDLRGLEAALPGAR